MSVVYQWRADAVPCGLRRWLTWHASGRWLNRKIEAQQPTMSKTQQSERAIKLKPRQMKRQRQQQSLVQQHRPVHYPEPDVPIWKPLG